MQIREFKIGVLRQNWTSLLTLLVCWIGASVLTAQPCPPPNPVAGSGAACPGTTEIYRLSTDNASIYTITWTVAGGTIVSGQGTREIRVSWPAGMNQVYQVRASERNGNCTYDNDLSVHVAPDLNRISLNCNNDISLSFGDGCSRLINMNEVLSAGEIKCEDDFSLVLQSDEVIIDNPVSRDFLNRRIKATLKHKASGQSCWTYITLLDRTPPTLVCENDTILCTNAAANDPRSSIFPKPKVISECDESAPIELVKYEWLSYDSAEFPDILTRQWKATDKYGNFRFCYDTIFLRKVIFEQIQCPRDTVVSCEDNLDLTKPLSTGGPTFMGESIYSEDPHCKINVEYKDKIHEGCGQSRTIFRTWFIISYEDGEKKVKECEQTIEVKDLKGPTFEFAKDTYTNEIHDLESLEKGKKYKTFKYAIADEHCTASGYLPRPIVKDACSNPDSLEVFIKWESGKIQYENKDKNPYLHFNDLKVGKHLFVYAGVDQCLNTGKDTIVVWIQDDIAPTIVVDIKPKVQLSPTKGTTWIDVSTFDEQSFDNCELWKLLARRVDWETACGFNKKDKDNAITKHYDQFYDWAQEDYTHCKDVIEYGFTEQVPFCCDDACDKEYVIVEFLAIDVYCNTSKLRVKVQVVDKTPAEVYRPLEDITITCSAYDKYYRESVEKGDLSVFGKYFSYDMKDEAGKFDISNITCASDPSKLFEESTASYNHGIILDNCLTEIDERHEIYLSKCGEGWIERIFTPKSLCSKEEDQPFVVKQKIHIQRDCKLRVRDFKWPEKEVEVNSCKIEDVEAIGPELLRPDFCGDVYITHEDKIFENINLEGVCHKIIRTWQVFDWCEHDRDYLPVYEQVIIFKNTEAPVIEDCESVTVCIDENSCSASIDERITVYDDCTARTDLRTVWSLIKTTNGISTTMEQGDGVSAQINDLSAGDYILKWQTRDACNNVSVCNQEITIKDCKAPSLRAHDTRDVTLAYIDIDGDGQPDVGESTIQASIFDNGSTDDCTALDYRLVFSSDRRYDSAGKLITPSASHRLLKLNCGDVGSHKMDFWVTDVSGNAKMKEVTLVVKESGNACADLQSKITGRLVTPDGKPLRDIQFFVKDNNGAVKSTMTTSSGQFSFSDAKLSSNSVALWAEVNASHDKGVTTRDLVIIQRYLLNKLKLNQPWGTMAADIDLNNKIDTRDLIMIKRLILGKLNRLNYNPYQFYNKRIEDRSMVNMSNKSEELLSFTALKRGDVNFDTWQNGRISRSSESIALNTEIEEVDGQKVMAFYLAEEMDNMESIQLGLKLPSEALVEVIGGQWTLGEEDYYAEGENLRILWTNTDERKLSTEEALFKITLGDEKVDVAVDSDFSKGYQADVAGDFGIRLRNENSPSISLSIEQIAPNPFYTEARVTFTLSERGDYTYRIYDATGKQLVHKNQFGHSGENDIMIYKSELGKAGIYYLDILIGNQRKGIKFFLVD